MTIHCKKLELNFNSPGDSIRVAAPIEELKKRVKTLHPYVNSPRNE